MFTAIYPELHRSFPNLDVRPIEMRVRAQQDAIAKGDIDVGLMTLTQKDQTSDTYYPLKQEELVLIIPSGHPLAEKAAPSGEPLTTLDLTELRYEPFVLMDKTSTLRSSCDLLFEKAGFAPNILFETNNTSGIARHGAVYSVLRYHSAVLYAGTHRRRCLLFPARTSFLGNCHFLPEKWLLKLRCTGIHSARTGILGKLSAIILRTNINYFKSWLSTVNFTYVSIFAIMPLVIILSLRSQPCNSGFAIASPIFDAYEVSTLQKEV